MEAEMDERMVDGNAVAGLLQEVFSVEATTAIGTCGSCGAAQPLGAVHVFRGAGTVLRCPQCDHVLGKIVRTDTRLWISLLGVRSLQVEL
jgi:hypothetical protein